MRYTIYLNGNASRVIENNVVDTFDVYDYVLSNSILEFYLDSEKKKVGFYKLEDVKYVLPKE